MHSLFLSLPLLLTLNDAPSKPTTTLLIGDSEVVYAEYYIHHAQVQQPNERILFDAHPGTTIGTWNYIFVREMNKFPNVDTVIIFLGTNNFNFNFLQPYQHILDEVKRRHLKCIWSGPTKVYHHTHPINQLIKQAVSSTCTYFDTEQADIELTDGVHPTQSGMIKWLKALWKVKETL